MTSPLEKRERFRGILTGTACVRPASVFDPLSARLAEEVGYESMILAGSIAALAVLGDPDLTLISLTELADQARRVTRAGNLPLIVDSDHGYGNALNTMRAVTELEHAGVAALTIEDTDLPTPFGSVGVERMISIEEGVGKMRAALDARSDKSLVVAARTSALRVSGIPETVMRLAAYEKAGVDAVFLAGVKTPEELEAVCSATRLPVMIGIGHVPRPMYDLARLAELGVRIGLQGHRTVAATYVALRNVMRRLRDGDFPTDLGDDSLETTMKLLTRSALFDEYEERYLSPPIP